MLRSSALQLRVLNDKHFKISIRNLCAHSPRERANLQTRNITSDAAMVNFHGRAARLRIKTQSSIHVTEVLNIL